MADLRIGIAGCGGRMGEALVRQVAKTDGCLLAGGSERVGHEAVGQDLGALYHLPPVGRAITDDPLTLFQFADAVIDFTTPETTITNARFAAQAGKILVVGTTGFSSADERAIAAAARKTVIVKSGNMSLGVNLLAAITRRVAAALGPDFDIEILEMHHRHKVDAPSGTALMLGEAAADGRQTALKDVSVMTREGRTGPRKPGQIGFAVLRGGGVVGEHSVILASDAERLEITHKAADRSIFAHGAVTAAQWGWNRPAGLYDMADVLGIREVSLSDAPEASAAQESPER